MALIFLSALNVTAVKVFAEGRIFFVSETVAFSTPFPTSRRGEPVTILRNGQQVGSGTVFRSRAEHLAIRLSSGEACPGDMVDFSGIATPPEAIGLRILISRIAGAPRSFAVRFDEEFTDAFQDAQVKANRGPFEAVSHPGIISERDIRSAAELHRAGAVILPKYVRSLAGDSIVVSVFDGATGTRISIRTAKANPFPEMTFTRMGQASGKLRLEARYSGLSPMPSAVHFLGSGEIAVRFEEDYFVLMEESVRFESLTPTANSKQTSVNGENYSIAVESNDLVIRSGNVPLFVSDGYRDVTDLAMSGDRIAILHGTRLDVLRILP